MFRPKGPDGAFLPNNFIREYKGQIRNESKYIKVFTGGSAHNVSIAHGMSGFQTEQCKVVAQASGFLCGPSSVCHVHQETRKNYKVP